MRIGIPKEIHQGERRVAATPDTVKRLTKLGFSVVVETGAGEAASFPDSAYTEAEPGVTIASGPAKVWACEVVAKVRPPEYHPGTGQEELEMLAEGSTLISFVYPAQNGSTLKMLEGQNKNLIAMDAVPRITRAQKLDALSSMANIAGYRAIIEAANQFGRFFTGQITAAGKVPPAKVMVIGAGVAGLSAIGAARGLGAIVRAFDTRPAAKEQVESMGAEFLELDFAEDGTGEGGYAKVMSKEFIAAEMALFLKQAKEVDIIVTTALVPGKKAPVLITREHVEAMRPGSVIVDLAAEQGGNCELTKPGEVAVHQGVRIVGYTDLPSRLAAQSSQLYGTNVAHMLDDLGGAENFNLDLEDKVIRGATVVYQGKTIWPPPNPKPEEKKVAKKVAKKIEPELPKATPKKAMSKKAPQGTPWWLLISGVVLLAIGWGAPESFLSHLIVFVLAIFIGWQVVWNVTPALHTPLMSVTNAISGIILIGGMLHISGSPSSATVLLGLVAILVATINVTGGFLVTQRMLQMFRK